MKRPSAQWVQLIADGGWQHRPDGTYWGVLTRTLPSGITQEVCHRPASAACLSGWVLYADCKLVDEADSLDDLLERAG